MSNFPRIKQTILAAVLATGSACTCDGLFEYEYSLATADNKYGPLIASCLDDDLSCTKLCAALLIDGEEESENASVVECTVSLNEDRTLADVEATYHFPVDCSAGRRPSGNVLCAQVRADPYSDWLATMTVLEASAVFAFVELARDLRHNSAPASLVRRCLAAAEDEIRHTSAMRYLARKRGIEPKLPQWSASAPQSLFALAILNATEGCVRETYGAALALWQSQSCADAEMRAVMATVARDEIQHAQLSAEIAQWIEPLLSETQITTLKDAQRRCITELRVVVKGNVANPELGTPSGLQAEQLLDLLFA